MAANRQTLAVALAAQEAALAQRLALAIPKIVTGGGTAGYPAADSLPLRVRRLLTALRARQDPAAQHCHSSHCAWFGTGGNLAHTSMSLVR